ncbi:hypothetical protein KOI35_24065 [Actinoplanes bogorensis]|uniref:Lipoprotein n=1 Tax=Paractinoplanes bogorensis TaxID=1610840 RepID=A0ABS5YV54_9ACTN|nr:hypothetical protein [Actinoplanes bogorensis]MBU2666588.1 hypothetical protein [Actinoplanes bogorensis]
MRRSFALLALAGAAAVAVLSGCSGQSATAASRPAPVTTSAPSAPVLANRGTDWPAVVGSMVAYGQWLLTTGDPASAGVVTQAGCASADSLDGVLKSLAASDAMVHTSPVTLTAVTGPASPGDRATVRVTATRAAEAVVVKGQTGLSTSAKTVWLEDRPELSATSFTITLARGADHGWRFCSVTDPVGDPDSEAVTRLL